MEFSDGEKLIVIMLADIMQANGISGEVEPKFVKSAVAGGDLWALKWKYSGLFHDEGTSEEVAQEVSKILSMCSFLEFSLTQLSPGDRAKVSHTGDTVFFGFDGNNEGEYFHAASTMVNDMDMFEEFSGRLNSHMPTVDRYRRMKEVYDGVGGPTMGGLSASDLEGILTA